MLSWPDLSNSLNTLSSHRSITFHHIPSGTYYRSIYSSVTGISYKGADVAAEFPEVWFNGLVMKNDVIAQTYDVKVRAHSTLHSSHFTLRTPQSTLHTSHFSIHDSQLEAQLKRSFMYGFGCARPLLPPPPLLFQLAPPPYLIQPLSQLSQLSHFRATKANTYGVTCGGGLDMWERNGWIADCDPYGWFQWYCRFYLGRRCSDDERQIQRGNGVMGPRGRWRNNLTNKVATRCSRPQLAAAVDTSH